MQTRKLGPFTVSAIGLGAMPFSMGANEKPSREQAIATVHAALDAGVTYIDTADIYAPSAEEMGHNEEIIAAALKSYGGQLDDVVVGTKAGITRGPGETWGRNASADYLRAAVEKALTILGTESIDLFQYHRPDRSLPYGEVISTFAALRDEGKIRAIGISNANIEEIDVAIEVLGDGGLASVQNEFSPTFRSSMDELKHCAEHGIAFLPWSPLGGTGKASKDMGSTFPEFAEIGEAHGVSPQQVALAWELSLSDTVIPIPGSSRPASITDSAKAADLQLSAEEIERLTAGGRGIR
ncbi:aldo/keto reductase [Propionibacteriaceae bacterium Y1700]|uniref:aldo/keto reductase n=1 Tax=Microlunatus sp. Y1700 TaxID=3418487 RepID=UPI003DA74981